LVIFSSQASSSLAYARASDVEDRQLAALLKHPGRFAQCPRSLAHAGHVVNRQRADHHVERAVVEGQQAAATLCSMLLFNPDQIIVRLAIDELVQRIDAGLGGGASDFEN
jgi:hypothetical protein